MSNFSLEAPVVSRRLFLFGGPCLAMLPAGCVSAPLANCSGIGDAVAAAKCRQEHYRSTAVRNVSAGVIIGAALGAGFALAIKVDPAAGAIAGALIGGGAVAAAEYLKYKMAEANYNEALALVQIKKDILADVDFARQSYSDMTLAFREMRESFSDNTAKLIAASLRAERAKSLSNDIVENVTTFAKAEEVYVGTIDLTPLRHDQQARDSAAQLEQERRRIEDYHKQVIRLQIGDL